MTLYVAEAADGQGYLYRGSLVRYVVNATYYTSPSAARAAIDNFRRKAGKVEFEVWKFAELAEAGKT